MNADKQEDIIAFVLRSILLAKLSTDCAAIHQTRELLEIQTFDYQCMVMKYKEVCVKQYNSLSSTCAN